MHHEAVGHGGPDRVEAELERGHDPEVRSGAAEAPEQIGVLLVIGAHDAAVGRHERDREQVVDRQAELPLQPPHAAAEGETRHAGVRDDADRAREVERLRRLVELGQERTTVHARRALRRIDVDAAHPGQVDDDAALAGRVAGDAVPAAAHGQREVLLAREPHGRDDVVGAGWSHDERGPTVDHPVPDDPGSVVRRVPGADNLPREQVPERKQRCGLIGHAGVR